MDSKIDFSSYSLNDLYSSAESIDRDMYPERAKEIDDLIRQKEAEYPEQIDTTKDIGEKVTKTDRLLATLIDGVMAIIAIIPVVNYVGLAAFENTTLPLILGAFIYGVFLTFTLHDYLLHYYGQTIGKHFMPIRIESLDGSKAIFPTIYLKRMLPMQLIGLVPSIGQFIAGVINPLFMFGKQRRCVHDYIAKTKVSYTGT